MVLGLWLALARPAGGHEQRFTRALVVQVAPESLDVAVEVQLPAGTRAAIMTHYFDRDRSARLEPAEQALLAASLARRGLAGVVLGNTRSGAVFDLGRGLRAALRAGGGGASSTGWTTGGAPMLGPPHVGPRGASLLALGVTHLLDLRPGQRLALRLRLAEGVEPLGVTVQAMPGACVAAVSRGAIGPDGAAVLGALRAGDVVDFEVVAGACR